MLEKTLNYLYLLQENIGFFNDDKKHEIERKIHNLEEDINFTEQSFLAKDSVTKNKLIVKETIRYANQLYGARLCEICNLLITHTINEKPKEYKNILRDLYDIKTRLQENIQVSFSREDPFKNPYPSYLFFSQAKHANFFSSKMSYSGVSEESVDNVAHKIREGSISSDYLRVSMYCAPYKGKIHPFVFNNRTWVAFSRSGIDASRVVPILPTQDALNRIEKIDLINPNIICNENALEEKTTSLRPG